uniref:uncharacterized protein LOC113474276 n=1 Tax=Ciona intestinalis TaxID=7719 RepID=UPI000EF47169|nr:uncharacterized protein LOC113474276 [Ciona intestinalis]|eukprot:XP_026690504.1 uncharacterized protein LOC113474276 [Ciona intestinalis]
MEIVHKEFVNHKAWPHRLEARGHVYAELEYEKKEWYTWKSVEGNLFIFSVKVNEENLLYMVVSKPKIGSQKIHIVNGVEPCANDALESDPRVFEYINLPHSEGHVLYNRVSKKYIGINNHNALIPVKQEQRAAHFILTTPLEAKKEQKQEENVEVELKQCETELVLQQVE